MYKNGWFLREIGTILLTNLHFYAIIIGSLSGDILRLNPRPTSCVVLYVVCEPSEEDFLEKNTWPMIQTAQSGFFIYTGSDMRRYLPQLLFVLLCGFCMPLFTHAATGPLLTLEKNGEVIGLLSPDIPSVGSLALGDLGTDGVSEIVAATGYGTPTQITALRTDGSLIGSFAPYDPNFTGGASVALCDLDGDGINEIVTGAGFGGGPHVRVFLHTGEAMGTQFFAYEETFLGGVSVFCADLTQDGVPDIITTPGPTGGPHIKVFSAIGNLESEIFLPDFPQNTGLSLFMLPDASDTLFITPAAFSTSPLVGEIAYQDDTLVLKNVHTEEYLTSPLTLSSTDGSTLAVTSALTTAVEIRDGSFYRISATPTTALINDVSPKYINVDISTQTLTAYEYGIPAFSFLVSTGVARYPTPLGKTTVTAKLPIHDYSWYYGAGNPANYSLPNVLWNLRFRNHYYIHSAYWHNNFGHVMSHGCVNVSIPNAEKVYRWAEVGTPVEIVE